MYKHYCDFCEKETNWLYKYKGSDLCWACYNEECPKLVNIKRTKKFDVYIGRWNSAYKQQASKWRNPDKKAREKPPEIAKAEFQDYVRKSGLINSLGELDGKTLACYCCQCKSEFCSGACPCHGNWLIEMMEK